MRRILALFIGILATLSLVPAGVAGAKGGWAMSTLDPLPPLVPGETADIGFTVRQHGVTPVDLSQFGSGDVGIALRTDAGAVEFFDAEAQGAVGHYVSHVVLPDAGSHRWEVRQGMFGPQQLGTLELGDGDQAAAPATQGGGDRTRLRLVQWLSIGLAVGLGSIVAVDLVRSRRHRSIAS